MRLTIKSRKLGKEFSFWMDDSGSYIRLEHTGKPGTLGSQICFGGGFTGVTLTATPDNFEKVCRNWYKQHIGKQ